jgi:hypothetical protein
VDRLQDMPSEPRSTGRDVTVGSDEPFWDRPNGFDDPYLALGGLHRLAIVTVIERSAPPTANGAFFEAKPETARGRAIYELLLSVHRRIRRDLERVEGLAAEALEGMSAEELRRQLDEIKRESILWRLQVNCLRYCRFVHLHHNAEDGDFFPELRGTNPSIKSVVDRLEADHRRVSDDLDAVEAAANALETDDGVEARKAVVDALQGLADNLLAHLDYEELSLQPTVLRLREWG